MSSLKMYNFNPKVRGKALPEGFIVTKYKGEEDIPAWCVAAGNPCRVIRRITEADRETYFRHVPVDQEALVHMRQMWAENRDPNRYPTAPEE